jgi:hypothetical protein
MTRRIAAVLAALAMALTTGGAPALAQEGQVYGAGQFFDLVWEPVESGGRFTIGGYVTNKYGLEAIHVRLMVEGLDASGRVTARSIGHVNYPIPPSGRGFFEVFVAEQAVRYRVFVLSWDWRRGPSG